MPEIGMAFAATPKPPRSLVSAAANEIAPVDKPIVVGEKDISTTQVRELTQLSAGELRIVSENGALALPIPQPKSVKPASGVKVAVSSIVTVEPTVTSPKATVFGVASIVAAAAGEPDSRAAATST
jgi:hypothetical protein